MNTEKRITVWFSALLVVIVVCYGAFLAASNPAVEHPRQDGVMSPALEITDWTKGSKNPKVTLTEYSDFQCPACGAYYPMIEEVFAEYKDRISFTYRHFPLSKYKNALPAAYASEAAGKQGKFWEMVDVLFKNQSEWAGSVTPEVVFESYAKKLGLNIRQYKKDVGSEEVKRKVENDRKSGVASAIDHMPTFFINGKLSDSPRSKEELKALLEYATMHQ